MEAPVDCVGCVGDRFRRGLGCGSGRSAQAGQGRGARGGAARTLIRKPASPRDHRPGIAHEQDHRCHPAHLYRLFAHTGSLALFTSSCDRRSHRARRR
jgi:hypothetical protein